MHLPRIALLCLLTAGWGGSALAENQVVPPVYVDPEEEAEDQANPEQPAIACKGQNCLPPQDNPVRECEGDNCAPDPEILKVD